MALDLAQYQPPDFLGSYLTGIRAAQGLEALKQARMETAEKQALISTGQDATKEAEQNTTDNQNVNSSDVDRVPDAAMSQEQNKPTDPQALQVQKLRSMGFTDAANRIAQGNTQSKLMALDLQEKKHAQVMEHLGQGIGMVVAGNPQGIQLANEFLPDGQKIIGMQKLEGKQYTDENGKWDGSIFVKDQQHPQGIKENYYDILKSIQGAQATMQQREMVKAWTYRADRTTENTKLRLEAEKEFKGMKPAEQQAIVNDYIQKANVAKSVGDIAGYENYMNQANKYKEIAAGLRVKEGTGQGKSGNKVFTSTQEETMNAFTNIKARLPKDVASKIDSDKDLQQRFYAMAGNIVSEAKYDASKNGTKYNDELQNVIDKYVQLGRFNEGESGSYLPPKFTTPPAYAPTANGTTAPAPQAPAAQSTPQIDNAGSTPTNGTVPPPDKRQVGHVYMTPKGPMTWTKDGWVPL